ncbi:unnamed protein product [Dovyalis caffra]|uniref:Multiple C2 domain-containing protein n=1 Tax=Dovyalis caffra TaxID=77055 RepID=A0AAV1RSB5_9ROSI|nr:unnamed protein product [Dovyalis caffra]
MFDLNKELKWVPPDSPLAPEWYRLEDGKGDKINAGELMLAVWMGTQADDAFPDACHLDQAKVGPDAVKNIRSKVHLSLTLWYVRVNVIEAQDLVPTDESWLPEVFVKGTLGNQALRHQAQRIVLMKLSRAEPPLRKEVVEYMLHVDSHILWNFRRRPRHPPHVDTQLSRADAAPPDELDEELYTFLGLSQFELWNLRWRTRRFPQMDSPLSHADELDEEFDTFPTSRPSDFVRMRYDRLRNVVGRVQTVAGDLATLGERFQSLIICRDPRATMLFVTFCLIAAIVLYVIPFQVTVLLTGIYLLRHPRFRHKLPSVPLNLLRRLPAGSYNML